MTPSHCVSDRSRRPTPAVGDLPVALALRYPAGTVPASSPRRCSPPPIGWNGLARIVHDRGVLIGIPDLRPHDLRRTLAGLLDS